MPPSPCPLAPGPPARRSPPALAEIRRARPRPRSWSRPGGRRLRVEPAPTGLPAARLDLDAPRRRFLAVTGSHRSPAAVASTWVPGDSWWRVGEEPAALVRLGAGEQDSAPVREVVLVSAGPERVEELVGAVAAAVGCRSSSTCRPRKARTAGASRSIGRCFPGPGAHRREPVG